LHRIQRLVIVTHLDETIREYPIDQNVIGITNVESLRQVGALGIPPSEFGIQLVVLGEVADGEGLYGFSAASAVEYGVRNSFAGPTCVP